MVALSFMPKCKNEVDNLVKELGSLFAVSNEVDRKRAELVKFSEDGEIYQKSLSQCNW